MEEYTEYSTGLGCSSVLLGGGMFIILHSPETVEAGFSLTHLTESTTDLWSTPTGQVT